MHPELDEEKFIIVKPNSPISFESHNLKRGSYIRFFVKYNTVDEKSNEVNLNEMLKQHNGFKTCYCYNEHMLSIFCLKETCSYQIKPTWKNDSNCIYAEIQTKNEKHYFDIEFFPLTSNLKCKSIKLVIEVYDERYVYFFCKQIVLKNHFLFSLCQAVINISLICVHTYKRNLDR